MMQFVPLDNESKYFRTAKREQNKKREQDHEKKRDRKENRWR